VGGRKNEESLIVKIQVKLKREDRKERQETEWVGGRMEKA
jgi:hypothetical protein